MGFIIMKRILTILLITGSVHADNVTLFDVNGTAVENFRRVRAVENLAIAATMADQVRPYNYVTPTDFVETVTVTNEFDEVQTYDVYAPVPQKHWKYNGEIVAMTQAERDAVDAQIASDAQAERDARPTRALEQLMLAKLVELDTLIGSTYATQIPFSQGFNLTIAGAIDTYVDSEPSELNQIKALKLGSRLQNTLLNINAIDPNALYTEYFGE